MSEAERRGETRRAKRWTREQAQEVLERWRRSGKSASAFAADHGTTTTRLSYWAKQIEEVTPRAPRFVAVPVSASRTATVRAAIEIEVEGLTLRVGENVDAVYVAQLVAALQTRGAGRC